MADFAATVGAWADKVIEAHTAIFQLAAQKLVNQLDDLLTELVYSRPETDYQRTGFLRASLVASNEAMPVLNRENPGVPVGADYGDVLLVINNTELGQSLYLGYTASYGLFVHSGTANMAGRPWVDLVSQRWQTLVKEAEDEVKAAFGL